MEKVNRRNEDLYACAERQKSLFLRDLEEFVNIDSPSGYEAGLKSFQELVIARLRLIGATISVQEAKPPQAGYTVKAVWRGQGSGSILLLAHADTVWPIGTVKSRPFRCDASRAYGPGVSDDKAGVALVLHVMEILRTLSFQNFSKITFIMNSDEEKSSLASRALIMEAAGEHAYTLCCEAGKPGDFITVWRKGSGRLSVDVRGRSAHAGSAPEQGRNAVLELAHQILQMSQLGDAAKESTVHFTRVERSENMHNVIPDHAWTQASIRVKEPEEFDRIEREAKALAAQNLIPDVSVSADLFRGRPPLFLNERTQRLANHMAKIYCGELGLTLGQGGSGGASDANLAAGVSVVIDSVGVIGGKGHTPEEYLELSSIVPRIYLLARTLMDLGGGF